MVTVPQWSPALTAGKSGVEDSTDNATPDAAAMEPGPHGREEIGDTSSAITGAGRNGARPSRPGRARRRR